MLCYSVVIWQCGDLPQCVVMWQCGDPPQLVAGSQVPPHNVTALSLAPSSNPSQLEGGVNSISTNLLKISTVLSIYQFCFHVLHFFGLVDILRSI